MKQRTRAWGTPSERRFWTEHIHGDFEDGSHRTMNAILDDDAPVERVVLFDANDEPLVTEPWRRRAGFARW